MHSSYPGIILGHFSAGVSLVSQVVVDIHEPHWTSSRIASKLLHDAAQCSGVLNSVNKLM